MNANLISQLDRIFHPRSLAIIGASNERKSGRFFLEGFIKFGFPKIYPINRREKEVLCLEAYPSVKEVPDAVDYAVVATPLATVQQVVSECGEKGVAGVSIFTSGYREKGREGRELEKKLVETARHWGTRVIGPNCMGIYCPASRLTLDEDMPLTGGPTGLISHSGSLCHLLVNAARSQGLAFGKAVSCGNEADLTAVDFLEYYGQDSDTQVIVCYLEAVKDGQRFVRLARDISQHKPVIIWKAGLTERGARAAASHTGALAGSREVWQGALRQSGITLVRSGEELIDCLQGFSVSKLPAGRNVVIISGPGGPAVSASDALVENGLHLAELTQQTKDMVASLIPAVGTSIDNPLDLGRPTSPTVSYYAEAARAAAADAGVDMFLNIGGGSRIAFGSLIEPGAPVAKPTAVALGFNATVSPEHHEFFNGAGAPVYSDPRRAARVLGALADRADFLVRAAGETPPLYGKARDHETLARARNEGREGLSEHDSKRLLAAYGIPATREELVTGRRQALAAAKRIGFPVGLKACGAHILHKTELGLVELGLRDVREVGAAYDLLMERAAGLSPDGVLVQEMVRGGREFVAGLVQDPQFGPCVMFGLGGVLTEALKDVSFRVAPIGKAEALAMTGEIRAKALLGPFRGSQPVDLDGLAGILVALSRLAFEQEAVKEIDINPLIAGRDGKLVAVDALVVLKA